MLTLIDKQQNRNMFFDVMVIRFTQGSNTFCVLCEATGETQ